MAGLKTEQDPPVSPFVRGEVPFLAGLFFTARSVAARALAANGAAPPALGGAGDFRDIRGAEKILEPDEDWKRLGTWDDPCVQDVEGTLAD